MESSKPAEHGAPTEEPFGEGRRGARPAPIDENVEEELNAALPEPPDEEREPPKKQD
ncbi:MAG TPA: hypothetical protein VH281_06755 [Gaiellaceae bacterium]|jgi:hypothetical protein